MSTPGASSVRESLSQANPVHFPSSLQEAEARAIDERRKLIAEDAPEFQFLPGPVGLALSGGGIRSATFNLGVLQALARARLLRSADYLSTVSGGGYIGGFLGRLYTRYINRPRGAAAAVEARMADPSSPEVRWLRQHGNYIAPGGTGDLTVNAAIYLRNFITLHLVLGICLFGLFSVGNVLRFGVLPWLGQLWIKAWPGDLGEWIMLPTPQDLPLNHLLTAAWGFFWSPWMVLAEAVLLLGLVPLMLGYWLASADKPQGFQPAALKSTMVLTAALFTAGLIVFDSPRLAPILVGTSLLGAFCYIELAWRHVRRKLPGGLEHRSTRRMVRTRLTNWLGTALGLFLLLAGFAALDTAGFALYGWAAGRPDFAAAFGMLGTGLVAFYPVLRWLTNRINQLVKTSGSGPAVSHWMRVLTHPAVLPVVVGLPPLLILSMASHALFGKGEHWALGLAVTGLALLISIFLGGRAALSFVNRSSLQSTYAARLARAYLGASNLARHASDEGRDVTSVEPDDDMWMSAYRPDSAGGPLHLINACLNETVEHFSQRTFRDRHGENLAVGPSGLSIGARWHALWRRLPSPHEGASDVEATDPQNMPHPLRGLEPGPVITEPLQLSDWLAISGAAVSPGRGRGSRLGMSLLFGIGNLRTGYWWNSGLDEADRAGLGRRSLLESFFRIPLHVFRTQFLLLNEFTSAFTGPWRRYWYLSDGGYFDNLGVYELIRRRVPYIIASDASEDHTGELDNLGNLLRKVRIDFNADIRFLSTSDIGILDLPTNVKAALGEIDEVRAGRGEHAGKHACLARVYYDGASQPAGVILYIKASITGDEPVDVRNYRAAHPQFPHDPTSDQFFDEAQWESYRHLGEHSLGMLFSDPKAGFWLGKV